MTVRFLRNGLNKSDNIKYCCSTMATAEWGIIDKHAKFVSCINVEPVVVLFVLGVGILDVPLKY